MVIAKSVKMSKPLVKVSINSDSEEDSSSSDESMKSNNELENTEALVGQESSHGEDTDAESDNSSDDGNKTDPPLVNEGWADSISKILGSSKPKNKKTLVLSRAKKHSVVKTEKEEKPSFEVIGDGAKEKLEDQKEQSVDSEPAPKKPKLIKASIRVKPNILEKDRERLLSKIATKGVVQLFNAVRNQQKTLEKEVDRNDISESKKEKILKKFDKRTFLDTLMGQSKSIIVDEEATVKKNEVKDEEAPKWSALRDDFMMGAKMKDWDKESVDE